MSPEVALITTWRAQRIPWQAITKMAGRPISEDAREAYDALVHEAREVPEPPRSQPKADVVTPFRGTMEQISAAVAERHGLTLETLKGGSQLRKVAYARFEAMALIRAQHIRPGVPRFSLPHIGRFFQRDHTTILNGLRRAEAIFGRFEPVLVRAPAQPAEPFEDSEDTRL